MTLQQLKYVNEVAQKRNFGKAAAAIGITQPTLSQQILLLEKELGVQLFIRNRNGVTLTDAGAAFIERTHGINDQINDLTMTMQEYAHLSRGNIRIGVMPAFSYVNIINMISTFRRLYPGIDIEIVVNQSTHLLDGLLSHVYDAVFITHIFNGDGSPEIEMLSLSSSQLFLLIPRDHPFAKLDSINLASLDHKKVIVPVVGSPVRTELDKYLNFFRVRPSIVCESSNIDTLFRCVQNGLGCAFIDYTIARSRLTDDLVLRPIYPTITRDICFAVMKSHSTIPSLKTFRDFIFGLCGKL